jgi:hypothetical protein
VEGGAENMRWASHSPCLSSVAFLHPSKKKTNKQTTTTEIIIHKQNKNKK